MNSNLVRSGIGMPTDIAVSSVTDYIYKHLDKSDATPAFDVYVVWFCYILGGWKCLVSSTLSDGMYYEVTYDKNKNHIYLDAYKKFDNNEIVL